MAGKAAAASDAIDIAVRRDEVVVNGLRAGVRPIRVSHVFLHVSGHIVGADGRTTQAVHSDRGRGQGAILGGICKRCMPIFTPWKLASIAARCRVLPLGLGG